MCICGYIFINKTKIYLQSIYSLLHDHNLTIIPNEHIPVLLDLSVFEYEPGYKIKEGYYTSKNWEIKKGKLIPVNQNIVRTLPFILKLVQQIYHFTMS